MLVKEAHSIVWTPHCVYQLLFLHSFHSLQWRQKERDGVSNHQPHDCLLNRLFKAQIKEKTLKFRVNDLYAGNSPVTAEFPAQRASNAENVSIWWRHHVAQTTEFGPCNQVLL